MPRYQCRCLARVAVSGIAARIHPSGKVYQPKTRPCDARRTLARKPDQYIHQPQCPRCGARNWGLDTHRRVRELPQQEKCYCSDYPALSANGVPHRKGSRQCDHHPLNADRYERVPDGAWEPGRE